MNDDHEHRYYLAGKTYTEFTAAKYTLNAADPDTKAIELFLQGTPHIYFRTEYAILSCGCGSVMRKVVQDA